MLTVITPTVAGREWLLAECQSSVQAAGLPHLVAVDSRGEGPAVLRNRLVARADTPWVLFLDDDDLLYPHYPAAVAPYLATSDVVYTAWDLSGDTLPVPHPFFDPDLLRIRNIIPVTACVRTRAFTAVGGFPTGDLEDHSLWLRLLDAGYRFSFVPVVAWHYRIQPGARSRT